jgi:hypothetical protein
MAQQNANIRASPTSVDLFGCKHPESAGMLAALTADDGSRLTTFDKRPLQARVKT